MTPIKRCHVASFRVIAVVLLGVGGNSGRLFQVEAREAEAKLPSGSILLTGAGATFPSVLYNRWFTVYHDSHPETIIKYAAVGSGEGVRRFIGKNIAPRKKWISAPATLPCPTRRLPAPATIR